MVLRKLQDWKQFMQREVELHCSLHTDKQTDTQETRSAQISTAYTVPVNQLIKTHS